MQKAFITGISGFVGSHLAEILLQNGFLVSGIVRPDSEDIVNLDSIRDALHLFEADLLDYNSIEVALQSINPDLIFHLAALSSPAESFTDPVKTLNNNIDAQVNLLQAIRKNDIKAKILIVSSAEIYGVVKKLPISESAPLSPVSPYGVSKAAQDLLGLQYFNSEKMSIIRVRPFNHIGSRQSPHFAIASFAKQIAEIENGKKEPVLKVGNLEAKRDFLDVRDVARAYMLLMQKGKIGEVYNVGSGKSFKMKDVLEMLLKQTEVKIGIKEDPDLIRHLDIPEIVCDNRKLKKDTGWKQEIKFEDSVKNVLEYWRKMVIS